MCRFSHSFYLKIMYCGILWYKLDRIYRGKRSFQVESKTYV